MDVGLESLQVVHVGDLFWAVETFHELLATINITIFEFYTCELDTRSLVFGVDLEDFL
jgi:hypothetical protein